MHKFLKTVITIIIFGITALILVFPRAWAQTPGKSVVEIKTNVVVFVREGCTHCKDEEEFLDGLLTKRNDFEATYYRLENEKERKVWDEFTSRVKISKVTPITVIGVNYIIGFDKAETTGAEIIALIEKTKKEKIVTDLKIINSGGFQMESSTCDENGLVPCTSQPSVNIPLPIFGSINTQKYPLLILSVLLGFFDGFNPCAMWVLMTFLVILLQVGNRKRMFLFAGTFIVAEALMYALILTVWYKTWDFVKLDTIITPIVGIVAVVGGIFFLSEWRKKEIECRVTNINARQKIRQKIHDLAKDKFTLLTFFAILGIAFSVNIIEFACSIGIPQAFTKVLELNNLSFFQTGFFIGVYILFYMIDDFIVFGIALYSADKLHLTTRYSKLSNLIGGIVMIILGLVLMFKSRVLLF